MTHAWPWRVALSGLLIMLLALLAASRTSADWPTMIIATLAAALAVSTIVLTWRSTRTSQRRFLAPLELPAPQASFFGRDAEINDLARIISSTTGRALVHISGPGGIGKTALAITLAHRIAHEFPDGQLYTNFTGISPNPIQAIKPEDVLAEFLYALEPSGAQVPQNIDERLARYHELSEHRRLLIVIDDMPSHFQLATLLPAGNNCAVIVTGRAQLTGLEPNGKCELGPLSHDAALRLLTDITNYDEPTLLRSLAESCGRQPLALRLAAKALAYRPRLEFAV